MNRPGRDRAATRCNSGAGEAAGAGVESPTVLPESEDAEAERPAAMATDRATVQVSGKTLPAPLALAKRGRGCLCLPPSLHSGSKPSGDSHEIEQSECKAEGQRLAQQDKKGTAAERSPYEEFATRLRAITAPGQVQAPFASRADAVVYIRFIASGMAKQGGEALCRNPPSPAFKTSVTEASSPLIHHKDKGESSYG